MLGTTEQYTIVERVAKTALADSGEIGDCSFDAGNWTKDGACEPWLFDIRVFERASAARDRMTDEERDAFLETGERTDAFYRTLEALRGLPGGRDFAKAHLIVAMYRYMEAHGFEDEEPSGDPGA
ncbi:MAG TPA: hypothetical protein VFZ48_03685 [Candidatus Saccharimonadales bacterium]